MSALNGGQQIWWEGEDFDDIATDGTMKLSAEATVQPPLESAFGDDYISHEGVDNTLPNMDTAFVEYQLDFVSTGGTWFLWMRVSHDRRLAENGRLENSCWVQVNGVPDNPDGFDNALHRIGQTTGLSSVVSDLWIWAGTSETGSDATQGRLNGLAITLNGDGTDVLRVYNREGRATPTTWVHDVVMISTVDLVPTDGDYEGANPVSAVEPSSKLSTTWGKIKETY